MSNSTVHETNQPAIANEPDQRTAQDCWEIYHLDSLEPGDKRDLITLLLADPEITPDPDRHSEMSAEDAMFIYDLESLAPQERLKLSAMLTKDLDPEFNFSLWDAQAYSLSKLLWQVESIARLGFSATDQNYDIADEIHGGFSAIEELCKEAQNRLEIDLMRPIKKAFKAD